MLRLCRVTKVKVLFLMLVYVFNFNSFEFWAAILEKSLLEAVITDRITTLYHLTTQDPPAVMTNSTHVAELCTM